MVLLLLRKASQLPLLHTDTAVTPTVSTPRTPEYEDSADTNLTDWLGADFDEQVRTRHV